ncbi:hypothetical protein Ocin01_02127 [Orchesella cincta]|uniref:Uncharacterized protein n=1 Tax=Orchesella cincta TaxID=48709 RepID=A0A1D2NHJ6_ORCCI|nr:hypothetical protein Ocin01_02127 [Orchesella cincta]
MYNDVPKTTLGRFNAFNLYRQQNTCWKSYKPDTIQAMSESYINSRHGAAKVITLVFGLMVALAANYTHWESPWLANDIHQLCHEALLTEAPLKWTINHNFEICLSTSYCSSLLMEKIFVYSVWTVEFLSFVILIASCTSAVETVNAARQRDALYHISSAVIIFISSVIYVISAFKMADNKCEIFNKLTNDTTESTTVCNSYFNWPGKIFAGFFGVALSVLFVIAACIIDNHKLFGMPKQDPLLLSTPAHPHEDPPAGPTPSALRTSTDTHRLHGSLSTSATIPRRSMRMSHPPSRHAGHQPSISIPIPNVGKLPQGATLQPSTTPNIKRNS